MKIQLLCALMLRQGGAKFMLKLIQQTELVGGIFSEANPAEAAASSITHLPLSISPLAQLNQQFLTTHQSASMAALQDVQTVMVFKCGVLSLWNNNGKDMVQIESQEITPPAYHALKSACHAPLICIGALKSETANMETWVELSAKLERSLRSLDAERLDDASRESMVSVLEHSICCIKQLQGCRRWTLKDKEVQAILALYKTEINTDIKQLSAAATQLQLASLHEITQHWIATHGIDLTKNRVLLVAPHGPRKGFIEMQYFVELYQQQEKMDGPIEDNYIYYVEMLGSQMGDVDIKARLIDEFLAREEQNKTVALWMLDDPLGMQQDVLKECAPDIIKTLLEQTSTPQLYGCT